MSYLFPPDKSLLYPQFETYRLQPLSPDDNLLEYPLPDPGSTQSRVGYNTSSYLSFKEVRNRIGWDHLVVNEDGVGVYVDRDWGVVGFIISDDLQPTFSNLASLPQPISSSSKDQQSEFPSVLPLTNSTWAVSSGSGSLYILETTLPDEAGSLQGKFIARYDLPSSSSITESNELSPFLLRASHRTSNHEVKLLLTRSVKLVQGKKSIKSSQQTTFELIEVTLDPTSHNPVDEQEVVEKLKVSWTLTGDDLPIHCSYDTEHDGWIVLCPEDFKIPSTMGDKEESEVDREKREREEKIGKLGLGASISSQKQEEQMGIEVEGGEEEKVYPYKWTQDSESINMIIPLHTSTTRQDINLTFTSTTLSLSLPSSTSLSLQLTRFLAKQTRMFWTTIDPELSTWTYDSSKSQIELDLSKVDHNVRWPSIFSSEENEDEDEEDEVPETLSATTLAAVRESFNSIKRRESGDPPSAHPAMPALLREEMDFDLDDEDDPMAEGQGMYDETGKIGKEVFVGFIQNTPGQDIPRLNWSKTTTSVLSLPLSTSQNDQGIIIKSAVDGLLFHPGTQELTKHPWKHLSTNPALAFVLSSKRDLRLIKHFTTSSRDVHPHENEEPSSPSSSKRLKPTSIGDGGARTTVLAFDSGSSVGQGNLYVYYPPVPGERNTAKQGVIPVSGGDKGALLGVGQVKVKGRDLVLVLTEKSLVLVKNVI
ncbi:hypothetical protein I302_105738 [Kwoniella bestiolae CBS 10118]|uniref:NudC domain-containing protein 1 n=1 Tax=Kwoniella bestiolae CBS 10118 TaxID=1296100 RepID=A0A1B9G228_9TREE|nr:hypothetical protein I302_04858 [Kwoniella bestiolae CBS 10118]OCF25048.1 hypothetical protein I302_04858 [Kwoniella bestiolae CBS 10118]